MVESDSLQHRLALTASWMAAARALESARADRLFDDPWASVLAGADGAAWLEQRSPESTLPIVLRTRFFDDYLMRIAQEDGVRQLVILAAGLDTRAFRLAWPAGMRVFELDQSGVLERKQTILDEAGAQPTCERHVVAADLARGWEAALAGADVSRNEPAIWLLEGFLFYLLPDDITALLERVMRASSQGSYLAFDVINGATLTSPLTRPWVEMQAQAGAPWTGTMDDPVSLLKTRGWKAKLTQIGSPGADYGRWPYPSASEDDPEAPRLSLATARRPYRLDEGAGKPVQQRGQGGPGGGLGGGPGRSPLLLPRRERP
jgi:methyltransferase (TIGR00027 family)